MDILARDSGMVAQDLRFWPALRQHIDDELHCNPHISDGRLAHPTPASAPDSPAAPVPTPLLARLGPRPRCWLALSPTVAVLLIWTFSELLSFIGVIAASLLAGIFPVLLLAASRRKGDVVPAAVYRVLGQPWLLGAIYFLFIASILLHGPVIWQDPVQRISAVLVGLLMMGATAVMVRRGAFTDRVVVEICQEPAPSLTPTRGAAPAGQFAISACGQPAVAAVRREQGQLPTLAPIIQHFVEQNPASATWRPGLALIYSELGWQPAARAVLEELAVDGFAGIARDAFWVSTLAYLSEVCAALGDAELAAILYPLLFPYQDRMVVVGLATACFGAVARFLGLLDTTLARWEDAERHFSAALALNAHMGARPWLAHTQHQYAAMLLVRGHAPDIARARALLVAASSTAAELGMLALGEKITTVYSNIPA